MEKLIDIFNSEPRTFSIEIFPPKTEKGMVSLEATLAELARLKPDFISVTYGAGGSSRDTTLKIVRLVQEKYKLLAMHHFTCVIHTKGEIKAMRNNGVWKHPPTSMGLSDEQLADLMSFIRFIGYAETKPVVPADFK